MPYFRISRDNRISEFPLKPTLTDILFQNPTYILQYICAFKGFQKSPEVNTIVIPTTIVKAMKSTLIHPLSFSEQANHEPIHAPINTPGIVNIAMSNLIPWLAWKSVPTSAVIAITATTVAALLIIFSL
jgi:membrane-bound ClpP family serine protease